MAKAGRPPGNPDWAKDWQDQFFHRVGYDKRALVDVCSDKDMPSYDTIYKEIHNSEEFAERYARATSNRATGYAEDTIKIADAATPENVQVARLQIDARKWFASKLSPLKYGEKIQQEITGNLNVVMSKDDAGL